MPTQSAGLVESLGSMSKSLGVGNAARNGLAAALFAEAGFTAAERAIEGRYGFAPVTSDLVDLGAITHSLGERWEILANAYKPYPCGVVLFPVIDACLELRAKHYRRRRASPGRRARPPPDARAHRPPPCRGWPLSQGSLQHSAAVAFLFGAAGLEQYEMPASTTRRCGRCAPSDDELDAKVRELVAFGAPFVDAPALIAVIRGIEDEADVAKIIRMTEPKRV